MGRKMKEDEKKKKRLGRNEIYEYSILGDGSIDLSLEFRKI